MSYVTQVLEQLKQTYRNEPEFLQAVEEILPSLEPVLAAHPEYQKAALLERFVEPERVVSFAVPWMDDKGEYHVNRGWRVQFNSAIGPYKGGLRFHPSVNLSILKFLGLEQILKNSLTSLPIGGGKGGSDFDPKGKSDGEIMRFCQSFMTCLYRSIGADVDVPAGDIGVGGREIGYLYGQYKRLTGTVTPGVITGKGISYGGSLGRTEATGYGLLFFVDEMMRDHGKSLEGMRAVISGSGNVAIYAAEKAQELGVKVVAMSDSNGYIVDEDGVDLSVVKEIKLARRARIKEYVQSVPSARYFEGCKGIWTVPCDLALPCATQNELDLSSAFALIAHGVVAIGEGANMPCTLDAQKAFVEHGVLFAPAKAANAGGVATSALEMAQNSARLAWSKEQVFGQLQSIMRSIYRNALAAARRYGLDDNLIDGANIAGFERVAEAMFALGI